jgi:hypothetical protein
MPEIVRELQTYLRVQMAGQGLALGVLERVQVSL